MFFAPADTGAKSLVRRKESPRITMCVGKQLAVGVWLQWLARKKFGPSDVSRLGRFFVFHLRSSVLIRGPH
jgi:hypothetical protein